jgi:putative transcriptional regulator
VDSARGQLLIASPALVDPNFWRTVVLIVEHSDEGALGLNQPLTIRY